MQLTQFSDIGLRLLMYLAKQNRTAPAITMAEVAKQFDFPRNHLAKVSVKLIQHGFVSSVRGRSGGLSLSKLPSLILIGDVVRILEGRNSVIDCDKLECKLKNTCELKSVLNKAYQAFFNVLNENTLEDVIQGSAGKALSDMHNGFLPIYLQTAVV
ncbi:MAG: Rrf2 family transcriptional regulator [Methylotenera sp.]|nr:Rrf2 family transcriptional regulator [Methylotenera sp.]